MLDVLAVLSTLATPLAPAQRPRPEAAPPSAQTETDGATTRRRHPDLDAIERAISDGVSATAIREHLRRLTARPHVSGSDAARTNAVYVRDRLRAFGFEATIETYYAYLPYPERLELALTAPHALTLDVDDAATAAQALEGEPVDPDRTDSAIPPYNAYSASATVEGPVVYAHRGRAQDFEWLAEHGVDVRGALCLIRYGGSFRGIKVREAARRGAAGVLLYSDPQDDGAAVGAPHPDGPFRPDTAVQRGSILDLAMLCGDPLTPGAPATQDQERLDPAACPWLPTIPCLPISARNAARLLGPLDGPETPEAWHGACLEGTPYRCGTGAVRARLTVELDDGIRPVHNVIGRLRTEDTPPHYLLVGGHRDAWVHGAIDPCSGTALALEAMRVLGELVHSGAFRPRVEIRFASWDGEEFGLIGSTEWCEDHAEEIQRHCLGYVNCDSAVSGDRFSAAATPEFVALLGEVAARVVPHDGKGRLLTRWAHGGSRPPVGELGSGSDFTAFVCRLGVPSCDFGSRGRHGVYHSRHDTFFTMERFLDPDFAIHASMARFVGMLAYRFTRSERVPLRPSALGPWLEAAARPLFDALPATRAERLRAALDALAIQAPDDHDGVEVARAVALHEAVLDPAGIPGRPWFRNLFVAPGIDLGYGAVRLPALREALAAGSPEAVSRAADALVARIEALTGALGRR